MNDLETERTDRPTPPRSRVLRIVVTIVAVLLLLGGAAVVSVWIQESEPTAKRERATRKSAALVETVAAERGTHRPTITVLGMVRPAREIVLSPRVSAPIVVVEDAFRPGGLVRAGEPLLRLDPADFEQALKMRKAELGQVKAELAIEEGRQRQAELEFKLLGADIAPANRSLVLREPQIAALRNRLDAANAAVDQAQLALDRTRITAPFDAQILERFVELGSQVAAGAQLARLVGTDEYWVVATVPLSAVRWMQFRGASVGANAAPKPHPEPHPEASNGAHSGAGDGGSNGADAEAGGEAEADEHAPSGARARVRHRTIWERGQYRDGVVERLIGEVDQNTRLARVVVSVRRPLGGQGKPPLILGTVVQVEIEAMPIENVVRIDRAHVRQGNTVWVMDDGKLRVRQADVVFSDASYSYVRDGVEEGDRIVITNLATIVDGLPIREVEKSGPADAGDGGTS